MTIGDRKHPRLEGTKPEEALSGKPQTPNGGRGDSGGARPRARGLPRRTTRPGEPPTCRSLPRPRSARSCRALRLSKGRPPRGQSSVVRSPRAKSGPSPGVGFVRSPRAKSPFAGRFFSVISDLLPGRERQLSLLVSDRPRRSASHDRGSLRGHSQSWAGMTSVEQAPEAGARAAAVEGAVHKPPTPGGPHPSDREPIDRR